MKKLLIAGMCLVLISSQSYAGAFKLVSGIILTLAGTTMAVDGFKKVVDKEWDQFEITGTKRVDISNPSLTITNSYWTKEKFITWWADAYATVKNTGNVPLKYAKLKVTLYDSGYNLIVSNYAYIDTYWLTSLPVGYSDSWSRTSNSCGAIEPMWGKIEVMDYEYDPIYETQSTYGMVHYKTYKKKNEIQGYAGIVAGAGGLYLIVDSLLDNTRIKKAMKKHDFEIKFAQRQNYFGLHLVKRI